MNAETLRIKHPSFVYEGFEVNMDDKDLTIDYRFILQPDVVFQPTVSIPIRPDVKIADIDNLAFHLGLVETISYWKAACSPELLINAGHLNEQQIRWWHDLFIQGLGEFYYGNQIDFTQPDFLSIRSTKNAPTYNSSTFGSLSGDLIMVGGGKDSIVTLETLRSEPNRHNVFMLNPTPAARAATKIAGFEKPVIVRRTLDPKLIELNKQEYLNGHTPFSAYLAFLATFVGILHDYKHVIVSNEQSANEGNVLFHGLGINHQYSKSFRFEKMFREYCAAYLSSDIVYFSFLRPLYELQVAKLFQPHAEKYQSFSSCNVNKGESWCGECAKCTFTYLSLFPFLRNEQLQGIFNKNLFESPAGQRYITELVGLGNHKPFDCVGTIEESILAVSLAISKYELLGQPVPEFFKTLREKLDLSEEYEYQKLELRLKNDWSNAHFLPNDYANLLRDRLLRI